MLLRALWELAEKQLLFERVHLQAREVHFLIPINSEGELIGQGLIPLTDSDSKGKEILGKRLLMPSFPGENNGGKAYFLTEKAVTVLGIDIVSSAGIDFPKSGKKTNNEAKSVLHYWHRIDEAFKVTDLPVLKALLDFRRRYLYDLEWNSIHCLPFLEFQETGKNKGVQIRTATGQWKPLSKKTTLCFQIDGKLVFDADPENPLTKYWHETYFKEQFSDDPVEKISQASSKRGVCMVTGKTNEPIARSHKPKILRVPGLSSGGYIVSFAQECPAFSSFGFNMGENAPISEKAAASYALALQSLIDKEDQTLRVGNTVTCFWTRQESQEVGFFARLLKKPDPKTVADFLKSPWSGQSRSEPRPEDFYSVTLAGNTVRVVVRSWLQTTLEAARENLKNWFTDFEIVEFSQSAQPTDQHHHTTKSSDTVSKEETEDLYPLSLKNLAHTTVRDPKNLQDDLVSNLYQAAIAGTHISTSIVLSVISRLKTDISKFGIQILDTPLPAKMKRAGREAGQRLSPGKSRFAMLKLILNRKDPGHMIESRVFETDDAAYNCGRLLAVISEAQAKAHDYKLEGAGVAERYFGTVCISFFCLTPIAKAQQTPFGKDKEI